MKFFRQTLIEIFSADLASKIFIAIMILIENLIRINQTLIENLFPDHESQQHQHHFL